MSSAWKVRRGHLVIGSSVCLSVRLFVSPLFRLACKVQYLKFGWWHSNQTWTVSSSMGSSHFTDITCSWGGDGVKIGLRDFCHISTLLSPGASVFHKHMSSFYLLPSNTTMTCKCTETQNLYSCCCCLSILFVCLFLIFIFFWYLNCLLCFKCYLFHSFIYFLGGGGGSQFSRNARPCPFITTDKHLRSAPVLYVTILVHLKRRLKCTIVITRCPSSVRRR